MVVEVYDVSDITDLGEKVLKLFCEVWALSVANRSQEVRAPIVYAHQLTFNSRLLVSHPHARYFV